MRWCILISVTLVGLLIFTSFSTYSLAHNDQIKLNNDDFEFKSSQLTGNPRQAISGFFTENYGQWNSEITFKANTRFGQIALGIGCVYYNVIENKPSNNFLDQIIRDKELLNNNPKNEKISGCVLKLNFDNSLAVKPIGIEPMKHKNNYFIGNDPSKWSSDVLNYRKVIYYNLWNNIDLVYYFNDQGLKYEFILYPGASPNDIRITVDGHSSLSIQNNELIIGTQNGIEITDGDFSLFFNDGSKEKIGGSFKVLDEEKYSFEVEDYDPTREIVIDPLLYSTFIGDDDEDYGYDLAIDSDGNIYITGYTSSWDFPDTPGAYDDTKDGYWDGFILKMNPGGNQLIYSTFIGGEEDDYCYDIDVDSDGNAYIVGSIQSNDFPNTTGAFDNDLDGWQDGFILKINPTGSKLIFSTYIGGDYYDHCQAIDIDSYGNVYATGNTESYDFPITDNAFDEEYNYYEDGFVLKLHPSGSSLRYSTFIGGSNADNIQDISVDSSGNAYVTGYTYSYDFPVTDNAYSTEKNLYYESFVLQLDNFGSNLIYSTFIGGNDGDYCYAIKIDSMGCAYITGFTYSSDFPTTDSAFDTSFYGYNDVFVSKLNSDGSNLIYSTFVGGESEDYSQDLIVDIYGNAHVVGYTQSMYFPTTEGAFDDTHSNWNDGFLFKIDPTGSEMIYSTYIGGVENDNGYDIELDSSGNALILGYTTSYDYPTTYNAFESDFSGGSDIFLSVFSYPKIPDAPQNLQAIAGNRCINLTWNAPYYDGGVSIKNYRIYRGINSSVLQPIKNVGNKLIYNDTGLVNGQIYYYNISAINVIGEGPLSSGITAIPITVPAVPRELQGTPGDGFVDLNWTPPKDNGGTEIIRFNIYKGSKHGKEILIDSVNGSTVTYRDLEVYNGKTYYYFITAENSMGESEPSDYIISTPKGAPGPPLELVAKSGNGVIELSWKPPSEFGGEIILEYRIYRGLKNGNETYLDAVTRTKTAYNDSAIVNGQNYVYYVTTVNSVGESGPSNKVSINPLARSNPPENVEITSGNRYSYLTWQQPQKLGGTNITEYRIYRGDELENLTYFYYVNGLTTYYNDTSVFNGKKYYYFVTAVNIEGESDSSNLVSTIPMGTPSAPQNANAESVSYGILISWYQPSDNGGSQILFYRLYRGLSSGDKDLLTIIEYEKRTYLDTTIDYGQTYYYHIIAVNSMGEGESSSEVAVIAQLIKTVPSPPRNLQVEPREGYMYLTWQPSEFNGGSSLVSYNIYRGSSSGDESELKSVDASSTSYHDSSVKTGKDYFYYITAINEVGESGPSDELNSTFNKTTSSRDSDRQSDIDNILLSIGIILVIIIIIIIILIFIFLRKRSREDRYYSGHYHQENYSRTPQRRQAYYDSRYSEDHEYLDDLEDWDRPKSRYPRSKSRPSSQMERRQYRTEHGYDSPPRRSKSRSRSSRTRRKSHRDHYSYPQEYEEYDLKYDHDELPEEDYVYDLDYEPRERPEFGEPRSRGERPSRRDEYVRRNRTRSKVDEFRKSPRVRERNKRRRIH